MIRVERPAVEANVRAEPARLDEPLRGVVAMLAQTYERTEPEFVDVAAMRFDVIADCRRLDDAALQAEFAQRMLAQLVLPDPRPPL
jgi:predicted metal-dependent HD superfamily phosphohydrolase